VSGTFTYRACYAGTTSCSNEASVVFVNGKLLAGVRVAGTGWTTAGKRLSYSRLRVAGLRRG
jgi:hypothetical protein